jgi:hypothetical protein
MRELEDLIRLRKNSAAGKRPAARDKKPESVRKGEPA